MSKKKIKAEEYNNYGKTIMFDLGESKGKFDKTYIETPLQAFNRIDVDTKNNYVDEFIIIQKALKRLEELEKAFHTLSKEDEKTKKLLSKEIEKNRALEIIKKYPFVIHFIQAKKSYSDLAITMPNTEIPTPKEYELLKEILKDD